MKSNTRLHAGETQVLTWQLALPESIRYPLTVKVQLKWRKYTPELMDWVFNGRKLPEIPITVMSEDRFILTQKEVKL